MENGLTTYCHFVGISRLPGWRILLIRRRRLRSRGISNSSSCIVYLNFKVIDKIRRVLLWRSTPVACDIGPFIPANSKRLSGLQVPLASRRGLEVKFGLLTALQWGIDMETVKKRVLWVIYSGFDLLRNTPCPTGTAFIPTSRSISQRCRRRLITSALIVFLHYVASLVLG